MRTHACAQGTMDLVEMVMAKADSRIAVLYDRMLVKEDLWGIGEEIRQRCELYLQADKRESGALGLVFSKSSLRGRSNYSLLQRSGMTFSMQYEACTPVNSYN